MAPPQPIFITADRRGELSHGGRGFYIGPTGCNSGSDIEQQPQTSAKLSYLARYCLFKALQYDLLDFWLAGGEGKRSSDGMEEHICNRHCLHSM